MITTITECIENECIGGLKHDTLKATTLDEMELIDSIHKLINKTKSIRKTIKILDTINETEYLNG